MIHRFLIAAAATLLVLALGASPAAARKVATPQKQVRVAFGLLIKDTQKLPKRAAKKARKAALVRTARRARKQARRRPCAAVKTLRTYKRRLSGVRVRKNRNRGNRPTGSSPRGRLQARVLNVNAALLQTPRSKRCGGGRRSRVGEVKATVLSSDEKQLEVRVQLPPPQFVPHQAGGKDFLEMAMEGMDAAGDVGKPGLPMDSTFFGIPEARASTSMSRA